MLHASRRLTKGEGCAAAGASEPVVSLPSQWLLRKNAEFERLKQRIRELLPGLAW